MSSTEDDTRRMNDTTMPPPSQAGKTATSTGAPITSAAATSLTPSSSASKRQQKALRKGFGLAGWNKLLRTSNDLAQLQGKSASQKLRWSEIKRHNSVYDGWVVLRGKVFNISPYLAYHPGGESILRNVLGKDITALYDKYHRWVNEEGYVSVLVLQGVTWSRIHCSVTHTFCLFSQFDWKIKNWISRHQPEARGRNQTFLFAGADIRQGWRWFCHAGSTAPQGGSGDAVIFRTGISRYQ
jgi:cytochrome b involved in lipid metabolism